MWSLDPFSSNTPAPICARFLSLSCSILLRSVRALSLRLCHVPFSLLRSWLVRELGVVLSSCSFFFPLSFFLFHRSEQGDASKFDESKCARLARLDYYTRREAALCQALNHVRGWKIKVGARVRRLKVDRLFGAIELSIATKG